MKNNKWIHFISRFKDYIKNRPFIVLAVAYWLIILVLFFTFEWGIIPLFISGGVLLLHFIYFWWSSNKLVKSTNFTNLLVFGYRRKGKDLTIAHIVYKRYAKRYYKICKHHSLKTEEQRRAYFDVYPNYLSLYDYGYGAKLVTLKDFELLNTLTNTPVTYDEFIQGVPIHAIKRPEFEGLDFILGEAHLSLPNTEHNQLDKYYKWLPIFIALSGHLYNMNIIINSQEFARSWVKLRNQQDYYLKAIKTFPNNKSWLGRNARYFPFINKNIYTKVRLFEEVQSAENNVLPFKAPTIVTEATKSVYLTSGQATKEQFTATNGVIRDLWLCTPRKWLEYDDRVFHEFVFGYKSSAISPEVIEDEALQDFE